MNSWAKLYLDVGLWTWLKNIWCDLETGTALLSKLIKEVKAKDGIMCIAAIEKLHF